MELRSGASWLIDSELPLDYLSLTQETDEGDRIGHRAPGFLRSQIHPAHRNLGTT